MTFMAGSLSFALKLFQGNFATCKFSKIGKCTQTIIIYMLMKIINPPLWIAIITIMLLGSSCSKNEVPDIEMPGNGEFIDHGFIPASVAAGNVASEFQSMIYHNGHVFAATTDGIWKNNPPVFRKIWTGKSCCSRYRANR